MTQTTTAPDSEKHDEPEPIAIIGIGCRFPGGVVDTHSFWQLLINKVDAISDMPNGRFDPDAYLHPEPATPGKIATRQGGFLNDIDQFEPYFFGISPREATFIDPQQRLLLEVAWEALHDAGQPPAWLAGSNTGVFVGMWTGDYEARAFRETEDINLYVTTGGGRYAASGRLAYQLDLRGPALTLDTACSSSLVAVHLACQSLWQGESDTAVAAAVNLIIEPTITIGYSRSKMLSPDGRCKFGDASANGYVRSEGAAALILKPLSAALAAGDPIHALIRGTAVNNDGRSSGSLVAPAKETQTAVFTAAYQNADLSPTDLDYIEAHGTGTKVGDPVELNALGSVLALHNHSGCAVGSIKTNIGHTEAASGMAGLIKATLSLKHRQIPPSLHLHTPNPNIPWNDLPINIPQTTQPWPSTGRPGLVGVNSFGVTGTNAHIVLQEMVWPETKNDSDAAPAKQPWLLPISAHTPAALQQRAHDLADFLQTEPGQAISLTDLGYTTAVRRTHHPHRLTVTASNHADLVQALAAVETETAAPAYQTPKIAFIFPGQGAHWVGMGRELLQKEPTFRDAITHSEAAMASFVDWSLTAQLQTEPDDPNYRLDQIDVIQPTLLAIEIALADLWQARGVQPDALIGHSMGEVGAAYVAGSLSLSDAMRVICRRSQLMRTTSGQGAMALVELTVAETREVLNGREDKLSIAVSNSPRSTVIAGDPAALDELLETLQADSIFCRKIKVDVASHSPQMEPLQPQLRAQLDGLQPRTGTIPIYTTSTARVTDGADLDIDFWVNNLRQPVQFSLMAARLLADGFTHFIEMSPHPILLPAVQQVAQHEDQAATVVASLKRREPEQAALLDNFSQLYTTGVDVDWRWLYPHGRILSLPTYPWQREHFWLETGHGRMPSELDHPFLDSQLAAANDDIIFTGTLSLERFPYLSDHRVSDTAVFPATAFIEMMLTAARLAFPETDPVLNRVELTEALPLRPNEEPEVQIILTPDMAGLATCQFFSRQSGAEQWLRHTDATVRLGEAAPDAPPLPPTNTPPTTAADHYRAAAARGLPYGPAFQAIDQIWSTSSAILADLKLPETAVAAPDAHAHQLHPVLLDAAFQLLLTVLPAGDTTYLPTRLDKLWLHPDTPRDAAFRALAIPKIVNDKTLQGDVYIFADGILIAAAHDLHLAPLPQSRPALDDLLYTIEWQAAPQDTPPTPSVDSPGQWLILADSNGVGQELAGRLTAFGEQCHLITPDDGRSPDKWLPTTTDRPLRGIVYLRGLDDRSPTSDEDALTVLALVQALADLGEVSPRLWLVTPPVTALDETHLAAAQLWGLGRVIDHELPALTCTRLAYAGHNLDLLWAELWAKDSEREVALRANGRFVSRLVPATSPAADTPAVEPVAPGQPYRVTVTQPGILDNLVRQPLRRTVPGPGKVEIAVHATGLNFMNVMAALGVLPGYEFGEGPLGIECAGVVTAVGDDVTQFHPGDAVMGIAFHSLASHATTDARLLVTKPDNLTFAEAATVPVVFLTAHYALNRLGRMRTGERVLIHAATGGVGQAAVQLAHHAGADIFATAGSPQKRAMLRELGIPHVMDSRSLAFADDVLSATDDEGVDLVLNSLAGEAVVKGLEILRPYGRFLEIGKVDIYDNNRIGLLPFQKNLSYFAIDLDRMSRERPREIEDMLQEIAAMLANGDIQPLPLTTFRATAAAEAFSTMAQAKHTGKIVVTHDQDEQQTAPPAPTATYLITGGLGALGLTTARWLAEQDPCHLLLIGRSAPNEEASAAITALQATGVQITTRQADVTSADDMARIFAHIDNHLPPLRGVIHAAGLLADSTLQQMSVDRFRQALAPKIDGAWLLHEHTKDRELDFFVLFSSVTAILGTPGQGNYAAANAYLDALAHHRQAQGLPVLSINWGPWTEIGLAAADSQRGQRLAQRGLGSIKPGQGVAALHTIWTQPMPQIAVMPFDIAGWQETYPAAADTHFFDLLMNEKGQPAAAETAVAAADTDIRARLHATDSGRPRHTLLANFIRDQVAQVLRLSTDRIPLNKPLKTLGIDSLMTLELRNRLERSLKLTLSATLIWNYPTVEALTPFLADKMAITLEAEAESVDTAVNKEESDSTLDDLSQDEVEALLADELSEIDDLLKNL